MRDTGFRIGLAMVVAVSATACVTPSAQRARPVVQVTRPHAEPDLVTPLPPVVKHTVKPGETLYRIARTYDLTVEALEVANGITDPRTLSVGQELIIPGAKDARPIIPPGAQEAPEAVAAAKSGTTAPEQPSAPAKHVPHRRERREAVVMPKGNGVLQWPLRGVLYARFGKKGRDRHDGIDLAAPLATPVKTARAGTVLYAGAQKGYGLIVIIDHGDDLITLYAHNRDLRVRTGQKVREGQVVSTVGESGRTSGPHLHFEVRKGGLPVDPLDWLGAPPQGKPASTAVGRRRADER